MKKIFEWFFASGIRVMGTTAILIYTVGYFYIDKKDTETMVVTTCLLLSLLAVLFIGLPMEYKNDQKRLK